ncbi:unnamed protein product [Urochloa humidicola]
MAASVRPPPPRLALSASILLGLRRQVSSPPRADGRLRPEIRRSSPPPHLAFSPRAAGLPPRKFLPRLTLPVASTPRSDGRRRSE